MKLRKAFHLAATIAIAVALPTDAAATSRSGVAAFALGGMAAEAQTQTEAQTSPTVETPPLGIPLDQAPVDTVDAVGALVARGQLQEAAWLAVERGDVARADSLLARLDSVLRSEPAAVRPLGIDSQGVSYTLRLDHGGGIQSIFKVGGSDIFCPACGAEREVAAYRIDRLLGFQLTPMTVLRSVVLEGDTLRGSAMYFIENAALPAETGIEKPDRLRLFDAIIGNIDRHDANWLIREDRVIAIDHNRAFEHRPTTEPETCWETEIDAIDAPRALGPPYRRYRELPADSLAAPLRGLLDDEAIAGFVAIREEVVERVEARIEDPARSLPRSFCPGDS